MDDKHFIYLEQYCYLCFSDPWPNQVPLAMDIPRDGFQKDVMLALTDLYSFANELLGQISSLEETCWTEDAVEKGSQ